MWHSAGLAVLAGAFTLYALLAGRLERWSITVTAWRSFAGVDVPAAGEVTWNLEAGDFTYYRWEITQLEHEPALP